MTLLMSIFLLESVAIVDAPIIFQNSILAKVSCTLMPPLSMIYRNRKRHVRQRTMGPSSVTSNFIGEYIAFYTFYLFKVYYANVVQL